MRGNPRIGEASPRELLEELARRFGLTVGDARLTADFTNGRLRWADRSRIRIPASELEAVQQTPAGAA